MPGWFSGSSSGFTSHASTSATSSVVTCHFCGTSYVLAHAASSSLKGKASTRGLPFIDGTWSSFRCRSCESWNIRDTRTGEYVQDAQLFSDPALNPGTRAGGVHDRARNLPRHLDTPFCSDCLTNQQLQMQLLAGFIPPDAGPQEEERLLSHLDNYKTSLDDRYPLVCSRCAENVDSIIKDRNMKAKARTMGGWLRQSARTAQSPQTADADKLHLWRAKGILWRLQYLATATICLLACDRWRTSVWRPTFQHSLIFHRTLLFLSVLSLFWAFWDPSYYKRLQGTTPFVVTGQKRWLGIQGILYLSRLACSTTVCMGYVIPDTVLYGLASAHMLSLLLCQKAITLSGPQRVRLVDRSRPPTPTARRKTVQQSPRRKGEISLHKPEPSTRSSVFGQVAFGRRTAAQGISAPTDQIHRLGDDLMQVDTPGETDEHDMEMEDVAPQLQPPSHQPALKLRPAVFNPTDDGWNEASLGPIRGLERLFEEGVSLVDRTFEDVPMLRQDNRRKVYVAAPLTAIAAISLGVYMKYAV